MSAITGLPMPPEVANRRTFAIISHPDAGKTTLTEKLLLYGGAIHLAGSVKGRKAARHATSDWMELEKQRGISVTSTVLQFKYNGFAVNILDTPGHQDFSEDTYRTLTAADAAVMLIDGGKGVEPQTIKLFRVCRMRGIPIFTFVNKLDMHGKEPLELMQELEEVLGIRSFPINWPIGSGRAFKGVYDRQKKQVELFTAGGDHGSTQVESEFMAMDDPRLEGALGPDLYKQLMDDVELLEIAGDDFNLERVRGGELTPMFFGSAMTNFGVRSFLESFLQMAPPPAPRQVKSGDLVTPEKPQFTGFVFKIQANMDPKHRDRIAFLRICSGKFEKGMQVKHVRLGKEVRLSQPQQFMAQERTIVEDAFPGDIIGLFDPGIFRIGDTLCTGENLEFVGIPTFSPELFAVVRVKDAMKSKQFQKGMQQLAEEGAIQIFQRFSGGNDPVVGVVGELQFDVLQFRLEFEYGAKVELNRLPYEVARWVEGEEFDARKFNGGNTMVLLDRDEQPVMLFPNEWMYEYVARQNPKLTFRSIANATIEN